MNVWAYYHFLSVEIFFKSSRLISDAVDVAMCVYVLSHTSCPTLCNPVNCSPPGSYNSP